MSHAGHCDHHHHGPTTGERGEVSRRLRWVLGLTIAFMVAEVVGGLLSQSLALLADAGHMFSDAGALALSLFAIRLAQRPPTNRRTFGLARVEILAALFNGVTLLVVSALIVLEAWERFLDPVEIDGVVMLSVAGMGLVVNIIGASVLHGHAHDNLNVRGAYLHILGDLLGSIGAIAAALIVLSTGWTIADVIISVVICVLILFSAWKLVREATEVLLESVPSHIDIEEVRSSLEAIPDLRDVHDVHVWTLTSGFVALMGHGITDDPSQHRRVLDDVRVRMNEMGIKHVTFQLELAERVATGEHDR
ncbi:MAG: cation diffusion facilitator family transporter [Gemmatimonadota bacterium]